MKHQALRFLTAVAAGRSGRTGLDRWWLHAAALAVLALTRTVASGLEAVGRALAVNGTPVPGYIAASGPLARGLFWPAVVLAIYLAVAGIATRTRTGDRVD